MPWRAPQVPLDHPATDGQPIGLVILLGEGFHTLAQHVVQPVRSSPVSWERLKEGTADRTSESAWSVSAASNTSMAAGTRNPSL
jgi:hypothetical protein